MKVTRSPVLVAVAILQMNQEGEGYVWSYALSKRSGVHSDPMLSIQRLTG